MKFLFRQFRVKKRSKQRVYESFADNNRLRSKKINIRRLCISFSFRDLTRLRLGTTLHKGTA